MFPQFSDLINALLGTDFCLPIQTFGFFLVMAFVAAYFAFKAELQRRTSLGRFPVRNQEIKTGGPISINEVFFSAVLWTVLGYKLLLVFTQNSLFCGSPQDVILSLDGEPIGAIAGFLLGGVIKFLEYRKKKNTQITITTKTTGPVDSLGTVTGYAAIAGILGAKLFHNLEDPTHLIEDPIGALTSFDGLTFYGGLICAAIVILRYVRKNGYNILEYVDACSPALMLAYGVGRIGCQLSGDGDWGIVNTAPKPSWLSFLPDWMWGFTYPHNVLNDGIPIPGCTGPHCFALPDPVYPTPFYEVVAALLLFGILWSIRKRLNIAGQLTGVYLILNGLERFFVEKIRVNAEYSIFGFHPTQAEIISFLMIIGGIYLFSIKTWSKKTKHADSVS